MVAWWFRTDPNHYSVKVLYSHILVFTSEYHCTIVRIPIENNNNSNNNKKIKNFFNAMVC